MPEQVLLVERPQPGVVVLTLNRPAQRNALNLTLLTALDAALGDLSSDPQARVVVLRGAGTAFCSGMDLKEAAEAQEVTATPALLARTLLQLAQLPQVTLAVVHGAAVAGGAGLLSACDIAIATEGTRIGYPEVRRGLVAALVMIFLRRQIHERHARELLLLGELVDADRAAAMGLVTRVVPAESLDAAVDQAIAQVLQGAPSALKLTKAWLDALWHHPLEQDVEQALQLHVRVLTANDAHEGMRAFLEKRPPAWVPPIDEKQAEVPATAVPTP
jgi:methylglutaconyl-CoA hydratase